MLSTEENMTHASRASALICGGGITRTWILSGK